MLAIIRKHYLKVAQFFAQNLLKVLIFLKRNSPGNEVVGNVKRAGLKLPNCSSEFSHTLRGYQVEVLAWNEIYFS